jgi:transcriptional regulator with XRE-family HTH domain
MGKERPKRLGEKLAAIRRALEMSQNELVRRLGLSGKLTREEVSAYERGVREPSLPTLSRYAEIARVWIDVLVDDDLDLPNKLPSPTKSEGIRRASVSRTRKR